MNNPSKIVPKSVRPLEREVSYETSIVARHRTTVDPMPKPWGTNLGSTAFLSGWWHQQFTSPESCFTHDRAESLRTGKILIPESSPYRIVLNFEDAKDPWAEWQFDEMERYRGAIKKAFPNLTLSAYVYQALGIIDDRSGQAVRHVEQLRRFAENFDEITPSLYVQRGDPVIDWRDQVKAARAARALHQFRTMNLWSLVLAKGKPLSPVVWWFVNNSGNLLVTRDQFWRVQIAAAMSAPTTRSVILWGDLSGPEDQRVFDAGARPVIAG